LRKHVVKPVERHLVDPVINSTYTLSATLETPYGGGRVEISISRKGATVAAGVGTGLEAGVDGSVSRKSAPTGGYGQVEVCLVVCKDKIVTLHSVERGTSGQVTVRHGIGIAFGGSTTFNYGYRFGWP
jgi:hypothetical protein